MSTKPATYSVDFVTALPKADCIERLEISVVLLNQGWNGTLAPMRQQTLLRENDAFEIIRSFPGALHPIRLVGHLEHDTGNDGTWVHGTITHDTNNQVLVEGMLVFLSFFLLTVVLFLRMRLRGLGVSLPALVVALMVCRVRWHALRQSTEDLTRWLRRKLYVTREQIRP